MVAWIRSFRFRRALIVGLLAGLGLFFLWFFEVFSFLWVAPPPSWNGVVPGRTRLREAIGILGPPSRSDCRGSAQVYVYCQPERWGWREVELWVAGDRDDSIVFGVLRSGPGVPNHPEYDALVDVPTLQVLVQPYGRPDQVMWGKHVETRYLIWARKGVAALAGTYDGFDVPVASVLIFPPRGVRGFLLAATFWPWPKDVATWSYVKPPAPGDAPDTLPQDPYDWATLR